MGSCRRLVSFLGIGLNYELTPVCYHRRGQFLRAVPFPAGLQGAVSPVPMTACHDNHFFPGSIFNACNTCTPSAMRGELAWVGVPSCPPPQMFTVTTVPPSSTANPGKTLVAQAPEPRVDQASGKCWQVKTHCFYPKFHGIHGFQKQCSL